MPSSSLLLPLLLLGLELAMLKGIGSRGRGEGIQYVPDLIHDGVFIKVVVKRVLKASIEADRRWKV